MRIKDVHEGSVLSRGPYQINQKEMQTESQNKAAGVLPPEHLSRPLGKVMKITRKGKQIPSGPLTGSHWITSQKQALK